MLFNMLVTPEGIWYRQSWLDTFMRCAERGRFAIVKPEMDDAEGDAALLGTGAHAYAETIVLGGNTADADAALVAAILEGEASPAGIHFKTYNNVDELITVARACSSSWLTEIYPWLHSEGLLGGKPESEFQIELFKLPDGTPVGIQGTADLPAPKNTIIDWKTGARPYKQGDKQKHAIQPSTYGWAAVLGAFAPLEYTFPLNFIYGVMIRPSKVGGRASTQLVPVRRTEAHARWTLKMIQNALTMAQKVGLEDSWPLTAENNWLCSERWCSWHSLCRGAIIGPQDDALVSLDVVRRAAA